MISTAGKSGSHHACFEKMPHVSSYLVMTLIDKLLSRATQGDSNYTYEIKLKKGKKVEKGHAEISPRSSYQARAVGKVTG